MTDYTTRHVFTARAGDASYLNDLPRGHAEVWHDQKRYVYDLRGVGSRAEFRAWVRRVWIFESSNDRKMRGTFPSYHID